MSGATVQQTRLKPRTLKDFLSENSSSCSSNGLKSFPRKSIPPTTMRSLIEMDRKSSSLSSWNSNPRILKSLLNAVVKSFSSFAVKSPSILPRSISGKLSKKSSSENYRASGEIKVTVRIKDIVRWRSFRDLEEQPPPLDFSSASTSCSSSKGSSWSDSDFTCGYLSSGDGNFEACARNDVGVGKGFSPPVGKDSVYATTGTSARAKGDLTSQEEELQSPISVLQIGEDEFSPFDQSLANIERRKHKCMQTIQRLKILTNLDLTILDKCLFVDENISSEEEYNDNDDDNDDDNDTIEGEEQDRIEKIARKLLHCVKTTASIQSSNANLEQLLLDFFRDEIKKRRNHQTRNDDDDEFEWEILRIAQDWMDGSFEYDLKNSNKDACIRDMDRRERWSKFEDEKEELAWEIETAILKNLVVDIFNGLPF